MQFSTKHYHLFTSLFFEKLDELRYKEVVRKYFLDVLALDQNPRTHFEIYDLLQHLANWMEDQNYLVFKIESRSKICVYRWDQEKAIIIVTINSQNVDKPK